MSELYMMVTITYRQLTMEFVECYKGKRRTGRQCYRRHGNRGE